MDNIQKYITEGFLGLLAFMSAWIFKQLHGRVKTLETQVSENKLAIELNTQSDKDYRDKVDSTLTRIEGISIETRDMMVDFNTENSFVLKKLRDKEMKK